MISKEDLRKRFLELISAVAPGDSKAIFEKMCELMRYIAANYDNLDSEAKILADGGFDVIKDSIGKAIDSMPETKQKRSLQRQYAENLGKHFKADNLIRILNAPPDHKLDTPIAQATKEIFTNRLQNILDFLYDIKRTSISGSANFAKLSLLYSCIDELLAAFHLAQRAFTTQAYLHIRSVFEFLDKVELFTKKPEWADIWAGEDETLKRKELTPSKVRTKIGKDKVDRIYSMFSELGAHGSFKSIQAKSGMLKKASLNDGVTFHFWIGGSPQVHHFLWTHFFLIYAQLNVMIQINRAFGERLDNEELISVLVEAAKEYKEVCLKHFLPWADKNGLDTKEFKEALKTIESI